VQRGQAGAGGGGAAEETSSADALRTHPWDDSAFGQCNSGV
jgi:hypothetical protein